MAFSLSLTIKNILKDIFKLKNDKIDASRIEGTIPIESLPPASLERVKVVQNDTARLALTKATVQNGDTVKVKDTKKMYFVVDDTKLNQEAGYEEYVSGGAASAEIAEKAKLALNSEELGGLTLDALRTEIRGYPANIQNGSIKNQHLAADFSFPGNKLADGSITNNKLVYKSITLDKIADGVLTAANVGAYSKSEINDKIENLTAIRVQDKRNSPTGRELSDKVEFYRSYSSQNSPAAFGNIMSIGGDGGSQMFFGWTDNNSTGPIYYRSRRDVANDWSGGWRKLAFSSELDSYVRKSGDTITGDLKFAESNNTHSSIFPSHYFHNLYNSNTVYVHAFPSHPAVATKTKFEFRTANGTSGAWTPHKLDSNGFTTPTLTFNNGGHIGDFKRDAGDAIKDNGGANVNIGSWFGLGFYSTYSKKYTGTMDLRSGNWHTLGRMITHDGFHTRGDIGLVFSNRGGGWFMSDSTWIRAYGDKNIFTPGKMRADGGFEGKATSAGRADSAAVSDRTVRVENDNTNMRFHWSGQGGQPTWLWGGNNPGDMYIYNPSNFTVSRANTAGRADSAATADFATKIRGNKLIFENGTELWIE